MADTHGNSTFIYAAEHGNTFLFPRLLSKFSEQLDDQLYIDLLELFAGSVAATFCGKLSKLRTIAVEYLHKALAERCKKRYVLYVYISSLFSFTIN